MNSDHLDTYLQLVADRNRRILLQKLRLEANGKVHIDDLVDQLQGEGPANNLRSDREQLAIRLYHAHLPKLAEHGVVEYDLEDGTIKYQSDEELEAILDSLPDEVSMASP
jgi:hypothetical protein